MMSMMTTTEAYLLANKAQQKLQREAQKTDLDLRRLITHAHFLDNIIDHLANLRTDELNNSDQYEVQIGEISDSDDDSDDYFEENEDEDEDDTDSEGMIYFSENAGSRVYYKPESANYGVNSSIIEYDDSDDEQDIHEETFKIQEDQSDSDSDSTSTNSDFSQESKSSVHEELCTSEVDDDAVQYSSSLESDSEDEIYGFNYITCTKPTKVTFKPIISSNDNYRNHDADDEDCDSDTSLDITDLHINYNKAQPRVSVTAC